MKKMSGSEYFRQAKLPVLDGLFGGKACIMDNNVELTSLPVPDGDESKVQSYTETKTEKCDWHFCHIELPEIIKPGWTPGVKWVSGASGTIGTIARGNVAMRASGPGSEDVKSWPSACRMEKSWAPSPKTVPASS